MENFLEIVITASAGSFITVIGVIINNWHLAKVEKKRFEHENQKHIMMIQ